MRPGEGGEDGEEWGSAKAMCRRNSVRSGSAVFPDRSFDHFIVQQTHTHTHTFVILRSRVSAFNCVSRHTSDVSFPPSRSSHLRMTNV